LRDPKASPGGNSGDAVGTALRLGVSGSNRYLRERIIGGLESLSKAGAEGAIIDGAANLEQKIRPSP
jgi:phage-related baseplate assembly protein